ncbi:MAG: hypothetical protein VW338_19595 [Rhodospirillaceae bacterium]
MLGVAPSAFFRGLDGEDGGHPEGAGALDAEGLRIVAGWQSIPDDRLRRAIAGLITAARATKTRS